MVVIDIKSGWLMAADGGSRRLMGISDGEKFV